MDLLSFVPGHIFQNRTTNVVEEIFTDKKKEKKTKRQAYAEVLIPCYYADKRLPLLYKIINAINLTEVDKKGWSESLRRRFLFLLFTRISRLSIL